MKGFRINIKGREQKIACDGTTVLVFDSSGDNPPAIYAAGRAVKTQEHFVWINENLEIGDCVSIEFTDVIHPSDPLQIIRPEKLAAQLRLEHFLRLEKSLKKRGLI